MWRADEVDEHVARTYGVGVRVAREGIADHRLRAAMGRNGRAYVRKNYRWDVIIAKYEKMFTKLRAR